MPNDNADLPEFGINTAAHHGPRIKGYTPDQMREYAESVNYGLLSLLYDIRKAAGDPHGKLMQDELVAHIAALQRNAERYQWLRDGGAIAPKIDYPVAKLKNAGTTLFIEALDAAIDAARSANAPE